MMRWPPAILVVAVLAGCAAPGPLTPQQQCEARANDDPAVKEIVEKGLGNPHFQIENQQQLRYAKQDATTRCLQAQGLAPKGGVQRYRPANY